MEGSSIADEWPYDNPINVSEYGPSCGVHYPHIMKLLLMA